MFVQVIQGKVSDPVAVRSQLEKWVAEVSPGAQGWLGSTGGVTDDGRLIGIVRFESAEAAQRNSDRPEQGEWWNGMAALFDGEPEFHNSNWVDVDTPGDPSAAGFVQVMQGRTSDSDRARQIMNEDPSDFASFRPDILGSVMVSHDEDGWTMAIYFTSEADAREGEKKEPPAEMAEAMKEMDSLSVGETTFYDLKDPWLDAPG